MKEYGAHFIAFLLGVAFTAAGFLMYTPAQDQKKSTSQEENRPPPPPGVNAFEWQYKHPSGDSPPGHNNTNPPPAHKKQDK